MPKEVAVQLPSITGRNVTDLLLCENVLPHIVFVHNIIMFIPKGVAVQLHPNNR